MIEEEKFFAWLDGELSPSEGAEMKAIVAANPRLARLAEQHRALGTWLRGAFDAVVSAPVPEPLLAAAGKPGAEIIDLAEAKQAGEARQSWPRPSQWAAMAATLAVGILVGTMVPQSGSAPVEVRDGKMYAAASLNQALASQLASAPSADAIRIGVTFRDQSGAICRSFTQAQGSGLACRDGNRWQVRGLFAVPNSQASEYRMAAGMDPNLAALIDSTMVGEPFDAAAERAAKERGWR